MRYATLMLQRSGLRELFFAQRRGLHSSRILSSEEGLKFDGAKIENNQEECDVAIVGGGMVGLTLASSLSSMPLTKHLRVAVIDDNPFLASKGYLKRDQMPDSRVSTVTPATINLFKEIGAWEHVLHQRHAFFDQMQVWDYTGLGYTRYNARDVGKEYLGCVVENKVLCNSLLLSLQKKEGFENMIHPTRLASLTLPSEVNHSKFAKLNLTDGETLHAKLVVGADGSNSRVREAAGIKTTGWNYPQSAIICTVEHSSQNHCAWQRFLPAGPIALLPIGDNYSNIVWTMSPDQATQHKSMDKDKFVNSVNHALNNGYGPHPESNSLSNLLDSIAGTVMSTKEKFEVPPRVLGVVSNIMAFPLRLKHANSYAVKNVVLVGDAAHTVHPLAGQGVNLGFGDVSDLGRVLAEGVSVGADISQLTLLKKYERQRKTSNIPMMAVLDGFQRAYSVDFWPLNILRATGFHAAQYIPPLKKNIISYAMGDQKLPFFS
ncbi:uncharacterized protein LOC144564207 isoform X1 [Carex rostrata]